MNPWFLPLVFSLGLCLGSWLNMWSVPATTTITTTSGIRCPEKNEPLPTLMSIIEEKKVCGLYSNRTMKELGDEAGTDKTGHHGYHRFYPKHLEALRNTQFNLLEIGMHAGASVRLWQKYFPCATLYGVDVSSASATAVSKKANMTVFFGDQADQKFLESIVNAVPEGFQVIVDDGGHAVHLQLASFRELFNKALVPGGVYIIEDIEASYCDQGDFYGYANHHGLHKAGSTVEVFKGAVDVVNREMHSLAYTVLGNYVDHKILSIEFAYNTIILHKVGRESAGYINRPYRFRRMVSNYNDRLPPAFFL